MFSHLNLSNLCPFRKSHYHCQKLSWFSHHWDISEHNCRGQPLWPRWNHVIVDITSIQVTWPCKKNIIQSERSQRMLLNIACSNIFNKYHLCWTTTHNYHTFSLCLKIVLSLLPLQQWAQTVIFTNIVMLDAWPLWNMAMEKQRFQHCPWERKVSE